MKLIGQFDKQYMLYMYIDRLHLQYCGLLRCLMLNINFILMITANLW